ncbi:hypothetical protein TRVA0_047S00364 [Trichomonascus vanleenenianus]|uniref:putative aminopeptidase n=1 Tax=Trichomonascus vanleenenianus TaxID=2268995 RepID=UPI003ECB0F82
MKLSTINVIASVCVANAASLYSIGSISQNLASWFDGVQQSVLNVPLKEDKEHDGLRMVEFGPGDVAYVTDEQLLELKRQGQTFIDVTDHADFYAAQVGAKATVAFPHKVQFEDEVNELAKNITKDNMRDNLVKFTSFHTRYYKSDTGLESSLWLRDRVELYAYERDDISIHLFDHNWQQKSLIARIKGTKNPDHIVIVGAHQDSINLLFPSLLAAPGADDDGSGTVTTLEIFRLLVENDFRPDNTVEFHWYSAEEGGLLGSQDIFTTYAKDAKSVKAMLQQDMTGYIKGTLDAGAPESLGVITDNVDGNLTEFIKLVIDNYCDIPYVETMCGYGCSDHASASKAGYPAAFVIESEFKKSDPFIHTTLDTIDRLSFDHMVQHAKLTLGYAYELGFNKF